MHALRSRPLLTRLVLAWFLLALGVAQVAPMFSHAMPMLASMSTSTSKAKSMAMSGDICSTASMAGGGMAHDAASHPAGAQEALVVAAVPHEVAHGPASEGPAEPPASRHAHTLDCVLCLAVGVAPHEFHLRAAPQPLPAVLRPAVAARIAALTGGLLKARAPPFEA